MSFENIKQVRNEAIHERSCIMLYQFTDQEIRQIKNVARMTGIKECIELQSKHGGCTLREILDDQMNETEEASVKEKTIILNHIAPARMNMFIDALKKYRMRRPIIAVITEQSIEWTLSHLLINLVNERVAISKGELNKHH